jgi:hypothetical protein
MLSNLLHRAMALLTSPDAETIHQRLDEFGKDVRRLRAELEASRRALRRSAGSRQKTRSVGPPERASYLLYLFLVRADRQTIPGDLEEEFTLIILPRFGPRRARIWFWSQTIKTIAFRNLLCRWLLVGSIVKLAEYIQHKVGG